VEKGLEQLIVRVYRVVFVFTPIEKTFLLFESEYAEDGNKAAIKLKGEAS
jgi:hypothetical protein